MTAPMPPCGWCGQPAIVTTNHSAPACRDHVMDALAQVGQLMRTVREGWDEASVPVRPDTHDPAVTVALARQKRHRKIHTVHLPDDGADG